MHVIHLDITAPNGKRHFCITILIGFHCITHHFLRHLTHTANIHTRDIFIASGHNHLGAVGDIAGIITHALKNRCHFQRHQNIAQILGTRRADCNDLNRLFIDFGLKRIKRGIALNDLIKISLILHCQPFDSAFELLACQIAKLLQ